MDGSEDDSFALKTFEQEILEQLEPFHLQYLKPFSVLLYSLLWSSIVQIQLLFSIRKHNILNGYNMSGLSL